MNIQEYKRGENAQLTLHFNSCEWECRCGCDRVLIDLDHVRKLEKERVTYDKPIHIVSGYRCPAHNKAVGGAEKSQHLIGTATDVIIRGVSPVNLYDRWDYLGTFNGIGKYNSFTHVDSREGTARW